VLSLLWHELRIKHSIMSIELKYFMCRVLMWLMIMDITTRVGLLLYRFA